MAVVSLIRFAICSYFCVSWFPKICTFWCICSGREEVMVANRTDVMALYFHSLLFSSFSKEDNCRVHKTLIELLHKKFSPKEKFANDSFIFSVSAVKTQLDVICTSNREFCVCLVEQWWSPSKHLLVAPHESHSEERFSTSWNSRWYDY